jgi:hypothetical protein
MWRRLSYKVRDTISTALGYLVVIIVLVAISYLIFMRTGL